MQPTQELPAHRQHSEAINILPLSGTLKDVLVVGAGVAGLQTARQLARLGCNVTVLEARDNVGGVWMQGYWGYGLQVPWRQYQFPEFPWPPELQPKDEYPSGEAVQRYVEAYADAFGLRRHVRLGCLLQRLRWDAAARRWEALYWDMHADKQCKVMVDYVVMCTGTFCRPHIPEIPGSELFSGLQLPAREFTDVESARGRRVLVIGAGKSALDVVCGLVASRAAESVSLLYRKAHWPLPRKLMGVPVRKLVYNRAIEATLPPYYTAGPLGRAAGVVTAPLRKLFWKTVELTIGCTYKTADRIRPHIGLPHDIFYGGQILDDRLDELMGDPGVTTIRGTINHFVPDGAVLQDGTFLPADVVLYCTGYGKTYDYLDPDMQSRLGVQKDGLYLYRHMLPHAVPHLAFVGSEVSTFSNIVTHGLQALWLARALSGCVRLPPPPAMAADVRRQEAWRRRVMPLQRNRAGVLQLYMMDYHDQLVKDMGFRRFRKLGRSGACFPLAECFGAYTGEEYTELMRAPLPPEANARLAAAVTSQAAAAGTQPGEEASVATAAAAVTNDGVAGAAEPKVLLQMAAAAWGAGRRDAEGPEEGEQEGETQPPRPTPEPDVLRSAMRMDSAEGWRMEAGLQSGSRPPSGSRALSGARQLSDSRRIAELAASLRRRAPPGPSPLAQTTSAKDMRPAAAADGGADGPEAYGEDAGGAAGGAAGAAAPPSWSAQRRRQAPPEAFDAGSGLDTSASSACGTPANGSNESSLSTSVVLWQTTTAATVYGTAAAAAASGRSGPGGGGGVGSYSGVYAGVSRGVYSGVRSGPAARVRVGSRHGLRSDRRVSGDVAASSIMATLGG